MPDLLLQIWKLVLLGFVYLFFFRVLRAIWASLRTPTQPAQYAPPPSRPREREPEGRGIGRLKVIQPLEQAGMTYQLDSEITIGRAPGCKINVDDTYVSQLHARVFRKEDQVLIEDLGSTNGTLCNGKKVTAAIPLRKGDRIQVGQTVMEAVR